MVGNTVDGALLGNGLGELDGLGVGGCDGPSLG